MVGLWRVQVSQVFDCFSPWHMLLSSDDLLLHHSGGWLLLPCNPLQIVLGAWSDVGERLYQWFALHLCFEWWFYNTSSVVMPAQHKMLLQHAPPWLLSILFYILCLVVPLKGTVECFECKLSWICLIYLHQVESDGCLINELAPVCDQEMFGCKSCHEIFFSFFYVPLYCIFVWWLPGRVGSTR